MYIKRQIYKKNIQNILLVLLSIHKFFDVFVSLCFSVQNKLSRRLPYGAAKISLKKNEKIFSLDTNGGQIICSKYYHLLTRAGEHHILRIELYALHCVVVL